MRRSDRSGGYTLGPSTLMRFWSMASVIREATAAMLKLREASHSAGPSPVPPVSLPQGDLGRFGEARKDIVRGSGMSRGGGSVGCDEQGGEQAGKSRGVWTSTSSSPSPLS